MFDWARVYKRVDPAVTKDGQVRTAAGLLAKGPVVVDVYTYDKSNVSRKHSSEFNLSIFGRKDW